MWVSTRLWGSNIGRGKRFFSFFLKRTDRLWGPPSLLFISFKGVKQPGAWTTHLYLVPRWRMSWALPLLSLYAFVAWTGKILPAYCRCCDVPLHWHLHFYVTFLSNCITLFKLHALLFACYCVLEPLLKFLTFVSSKCLLCTQLFVPDAEVMIISWVLSH